RQASISSCLAREWRAKAQRSSSASLRATDRERLTERAGGGHGLMDTRTRLRTALESPFFDFAPWIVMSVLVGPQRFVLAASLATASSCAIAGANWLLGVKPKMLDDVGIAFFAALIVVGLAVDDTTRHWFERWSGDLSNVLIMLIALGSIVVR